MKLKPALALLFIVTAALCHAQSMTGIWRGYFLSGSGLSSQRYNYEIQMLQSKSKPGDATRRSIKGVTYSYLTTSFYGKAGLRGLYNVSTKEITIVEDTLVEVKNMTGGFSCLMTCYLGYRKVANTEILEGTFTSINISDKGDCGGGYVYLERVPESDFHKEDFLVNKAAPSKPSAASKPPVSASKNTASASQKPTATPIRKMPSGKNFDTAAIQQPAAVTPAPPAMMNITKTLPSAPRVLVERENNLVRTITTNDPKIHIALYDNGIVDGDTITVYHNNALLVDSKELTEKPIVIDITADSVNTHHEFIMVANNLGKIPPNTALLVVTTGGKRYEVNISSDEKRNAKLVIDYVP